MAVYLLSAARFSGSYKMLALILVYALRTAAQDVPALLRSPADRTDPRWTTLAQLSRAVPELPVVIGGALSYPEAARSAPLEVRDRLAGIAEPELAIRFIGTDTPDRSNQILAQYALLRIVALAGAHRVAGRCPHLHLNRTPGAIFHRGGLKASR